MRVVALILAPTLCWAEDNAGQLLIPELDDTRACAFAESNEIMTMEYCRRLNSVAKSVLEQSWGDLPPSIVNTCLQEEADRETGSYGMLMMCIDLAFQGRTPPDVVEQ